MQDAGSVEGEIGWLYYALSHLTIYSFETPANLGAQLCRLAPGKNYIDRDERVFEFVRMNL